ncbi:MAG TPA: cation transporter [Woeseiaceae bacterium]|nr:cation transporter [Woeseiaceae bacterium]
MSKFLATGAVMAFLFAAVPTHAETTTATLTVDKMSCVTCPLTVRKAMERVPGVIEVDVDYDSKTATVTFDDEQTSIDEIANASTEIGYPATPK